MEYSFTNCLETPISRKQNSWNLKCSSETMFKRFKTGAITFKVLLAGMWPLGRHSLNKIVELKRSKVHWLIEGRMLSTITDPGSQILLQKRTFV